MMEARGGEGGEREENHNRRLGEKIIFLLQQCKGRMTAKLHH